MLLEQSSRHLLINTLQLIVFPGVHYCEPEYVTIASAFWNTDVCAQEGLITFKGSKLKKKKSKPVKVNRHFPANLRRKPMINIIERETQEHRPSYTCSFI